MERAVKVEFYSCCLILFYFISHGLHELQRHSGALDRLKRPPQGGAKLTSGWKYVPRKKDGDLEWNSFCSMGLIDIILAISCYI